MTKITPLWKRVVVKPKSPETETSSWIILPDSKEKPMEWEVISVWCLSSWKDDKCTLDIKKWDIVLFKKYSPTEVKVNWEELFILDIDDLLAKVA